MTDPSDAVLALYLSEDELEHVVLQPVLCGVVVVVLLKPCAEVHDRMYQSIPKTLSRTTEDAGGIAEASFWRVPLAAARTDESRLLSIPEVFLHKREQPAEPTQAPAAAPANQPAKAAPTSAAASARVTIDGAPPAAARSAKRIAVVPQQPGLVPWRSVDGNARLLLDVNPGATPAAHPDPAALLEEVGLADFAERLPHELSGGMQQRVALVRAVALGAPVMLMDEPFASLDEITRTEMRALLARLLALHPATVLLVTHSIPEAVALSDRVLVVGPRPARITADVTIDLARPRPADVEDDPAFVAHCGELRRRLHEAMGR